MGQIFFREYCWQRGSCFAIGWCFYVASTKLRQRHQLLSGYVRDVPTLTISCELMFNSFFEQKVAYYSKMQEAQECNASPSSSASGSSSFSNQTPASVKEEEGSPEKERPPEAEYINSRCVLFTYFQGDISSVVDEHFSRALSQPSSYTPSCTSSKAHRSSGPWRGEWDPVEKSR